MKCLCNRWVFVWNPCTFEIDGLVCTRSASSFCRNPLKFCTHVMSVKWWFHAKCQPLLSSGCSPFQFQGHLPKNKSLNAWKIANVVRKGWNFSMWLWLLHIGCKKVLSLNKLRKMKCLWNRWVFVWNPRTLKEMVQFVHEVHPVFAVILSTFAHMLCGSNDDTMPSFNLFWVQVVALSNFKVIYLKINH